MFGDSDPAALDGKARAAFRAGFLGIASLGWSTLVQVVEASEADRAAAVALLAEQLRTQFGAPSEAAALAAAADEVAFAASLCDRPLDTLVAIHRSHEDGAIREAFRSLHARGVRKPMRAFAFLEVEGEDDPAERVDLTKLGKS
jgi:hypothetical protein